MSDALRKQIIAAIERSGRSQRDLAAQVGIAQPRIAEFRGGRYDLRLSQAQALAQACGYDLVLRKRREKG